MTSAANTIVELIACQSHQTPDALAILAPGRSPLTYRALTQTIENAIAALAAAGVGRGDRVALVVPNGPEMAVALIAVMGCAQCAPLSPSLDEASYLFALRALHVDVLIVMEGEDTPVIRAAQALTLPLVRLAVSPREPAGRFCLIAGGSRPRAAVAVPELRDVALVLQTSGTTAQPKAVPITHGNLAAGALARARHVRHTRVDRCLCVAPLYSGMAIRRCLVPVLVTGGSVVCTPGYDATLFFAWLDEFKPTFYMAVPAFHRAVLDENERRGGALPSALRFIGSESATLPDDMERRLEDTFGVPVVQGYGLTETGLIAQTPLPPGHRRAGSVGLAVVGEVAVLDGNHVPISSDQPGEIVVRGAAVFGGYEDDPEANREAFHDGWFRTGDLGYIDQDGYLFIVGRVKELINRGGTKVSPAAVDAVLLRHPAVRDAGTFPVPHPTLGQDVVTAVVLHECAQSTPQELRDFAFAHLPDFAVPSRVLLVANLPRTPRGKLKRDELSAVFSPQLNVAFTPPRDGSEERVARYFGEVLGCDTVGAFDHFFQLGGDSLRGARLVARVNSNLGTDIDVACLFRRPTVAEFAAELASAVNAQPLSASPPIKAWPRRRYRADATQGE